MADGSSGWVQVVPWVVSALGWIVVNRQSNDRETRKELRGRADAVKKLIDELETQAIDYHTVGATPAKSASIKKLLTRIGRELEMLDRLGVNATNRIGRMLVLRNAITFQNFDSESYQVMPPGDKLLSDIGEAADDLRLGVEGGYSERYHAKSWKQRLFGTD